MGVGRWEYRSAASGNEPHVASHSPQPHVWRGHWGRMGPGSGQREAVRPNGGRGCATGCQAQFVGMGATPSPSP